MSLLPTAFATPTQPYYTPYTEVTQGESTIVAINPFAIPTAPVTTTYNAGSSAIIQIPAPYPALGSAWWEQGKKYRITWCGYQYNNSATPGTVISYGVQMAKSTVPGFYPNNPNVLKTPSVTVGDALDLTWSLVIAAPPAGDLTQGFAGLQIIVGTTDPNNGGVCITKSLAIEKLAD